MNTQPKALLLAEQLRDLSTKFKTPSHEKGVCNGASFELRRLHEVNQAMLDALKLAGKNAGNPEAVYKITKAAIAKGEQQCKS